MNATNSTNERVRPSRSRTSTHNINTTTRQPSDARLDQTNDALHRNLSNDPSESRPIESTSIDPHSDVESVMSTNHSLESTILPASLLPLSLSGDQAQSHQAQSIVSSAISQALDSNTENSLGGWYLLCSRTV